MLAKIKQILNSQFYAFSLYARQIAGTFILFIIAHYLSVYDYGLFSSYRNIATFVLMFANLGFCDYILVSSKANVKEVRLKIALFLVNSIVWVVICASASIFCRLESHLLFIMVLFRTFLDGIFFSLILPYFQAAKKFNQIARINFFYSIAVTLIAIISFIFKLSLIKFLLLNIALGIFNFIQCSYFAKINYILLLCNIKKFLGLFDKEIFSFIGVTIAYYLYAQVPSLYVSTTQPKELAALYFSAFTISNIVGLLLAAQTQKMLPEMINKDSSTVRKIIKKNMFFIMSVILGVFLFMAVFGKLLLSLLYGQAYYIGAYPVLLILMLGNICVAEAAVYGTYITASGNQRKKIPMQLKATLVTMVSLLLFHKWGIIGAGCSFLLAAIYVSYLYTTFTIKFLKQQEQQENNIKEHTCSSKI